MGDTIKSALIGGVFTVVGAIIGAGATHYFNSIENGNYQEKYLSLEKDYEELKKENQRLNELNAGKNTGQESNLGEKEDINSDENITNADSISALNMQPFHSNKVDFDKKIIKDKKGNSFSNALILHSMDAPEYGEDRIFNLEYQLDFKYSRITATIAFCGENIEAYNNINIYFEIYADETLVYTSDLVGEKTNPINIDVTIQNPEYVEFVVHNQETPFEMELIVDSLQFYK